MVVAKYVAVDQNRALWLAEIMPVPDSLPWMESVDAKMARAKEHLDTLYAEAGAFFESTKRNFILKELIHALPLARVPTHKM